MVKAANHKEEKCSISKAPNQGSSSKAMYYVCKVTVKSLITKPQSDSDSDLVLLYLNQKPGRLEEKVRTHYSILALIINH